MQRTRGSHPRLLNEDSVPQNVPGRNPQASLQAAWEHTNTIIPQQQGTQAWDRYAGMNNNPVKYTDPSGHDVDCAISEPDCQAGLHAGKSPLPKPSTASGKRHDAHKTGCTGTLAQCFSERSVIDFSDHEQIDQSEFDDLLKAIHYDIQRVNRGSFDAARSTYDTPFFDGNQRRGESTRPNQMVCFGEDCYNQSSVNYVAQGMYSAAAGQSLDDAIFIVEAWNLIQYLHRADEDDIYWLTYGYKYYLEHQEGAP